MVAVNLVDPDPVSITLEVQVMQLDNQASVARKDNTNKDSAVQVDILVTSTLIPVHSTVQQPGLVDSVGSKVDKVIKVVSTAEATAASLTTAMATLDVAHGVEAMDIELGDRRPQSQMSIL